MIIHCYDPAECQEWGSFGFHHGSDRARCHIDALDAASLKRIPEMVL